MTDKNYYFDIAIHKAVHEETATLLQDVLETGRKGQKQFIEDCAKGSGRIPDPSKDNRLRYLPPKLANFKIQMDRIKSLCLSLWQETSLETSCFMPY